MKNIWEYKGYHTKVEFDTEKLMLYGKVEGINDLVTFESSTIKNAKKEFEKAVDEYLAFCKEVGKSPMSPITLSHKLFLSTRQVSARPWGCRAVIMPKSSSIIVILSHGRWKVCVSGSQRSTKAVRAEWTSVGGARLNKSTKGSNPALLMCDSKWWSYRIWHASVWPLIRKVGSICQNEDENSKYLTFTKPKYYKCRWPWLLPLHSQLDGSDDRCWM